MDFKRLSGAKNVTIDFKYDVVTMCLFSVYLL